jgi:pimeloyl-ACP methyl ester carboxylesterase
MTGQTMQKDEVLADDGEILQVYRCGSGPALLLLHGWTASHAAWSPLLVSLSEKFTVLRPDARGHGTHQARVNPLPDVQRLARDVIHILDHYGLTQVAAIGHSMGALTLWQCVRDFGADRFSHLAFIDQSPKLMTDATWQGGIYGDFDAERSAQFVADLTHDFAESVLRLGAFGLNDKARATYGRNSSGWRAAREALGHMQPSVAIAIWKSLVAADYRDVLPHIQVPALLAYGSASNFYSLATARYVASRLPHAHLSLYEDADHSPHLADPARFAAELVALVNPPAGNGGAGTA